jgi:glycosyltransferase involved in cell wall biosynthesis
MKQPRVSVVMIAYNVGKYIGQAIESVLAQNVDFSYEIVVGEDCSTDSTREILAGYAAKHPDIIRVILRERNLGMNPNFFATWSECRGDFIALLDADDYWISSEKLRKQIDFLESHPECAICFHNALVVYDDDPEEAHPFHLREPEHRISAAIPRARSGLNELVQGNFMQTGSVMYRGGLVRELPDWVFDMPTFDWPLHVLHAEQGDIGYLDEMLSAYRVHSGGFWSSNLSHYRTVEETEGMIRAYQAIDRHLGGQHRAAMKPGLAFLYARAMKLTASAGDYRLASRYAARYLGALPYRQRARERYAISILLRGKAPGIHRLARSLRTGFRQTDRPS